MVEPIGIAVIVLGAVLLFAGAALSVYGVALLGAVVGGSGAFLLAPTIGGAVGVEGIALTAGVLLAGAAVGVVLAYTLLSMVVAGAGFAVGTFVGLNVINPLFVSGEWYVEVGAAVGVGLVAAFLGMLVTKTMLVGVTAFVGAAFASTQVTPDSLQAAADGPTIDPLLVDVADPVFAGLFVLGLLAQIGLFRFGYVSKLTALLPGARVIRNRGEEEGGAPGT